MIVLKNIVTAAHSGLYVYHTKEQIDSIFLKYCNSIDNSTDPITYFRYVSSIVTYIGSLHDDVSLPGLMEDSLKARSQFFPFPVKVIDKKLVANITHKNIAVGSAIVSINNVSIDSILPRLYKYYTTDGYNITGKNEGIDDQFPWFYRLEFGPCDNFHIVYRPLRQENDTVRLKGITYKAYNLLFKNRHSLALDTGTGSRYSFRMIDSLNAARLTVNTFRLGGRSTASHRKYRHFLKNTFLFLQKRHISKLIVDVRQNGGGNDPNDLLTFSYLAHDNFKENLASFCIFKKVPFREYYYSEDTADKKKDIRSVEKFLSTRYTRQYDGKYYQSPKYNRTWKPNKLSFKGDIYVLIDHSVASAASLFASLVKSDGHATLIGEETIGAYHGHTGWEGVSYQLPYSKIVVSFSVINLRQYVKPKNDVPFGSGVIPDVRVIQKQEDFVEGRDAVLLFTLGRIAAGNRANAHD